MRIFKPLALLIPVAAIAQAAKFEKVPGTVRFEQPVFLLEESRSESPQLRHFWVLEKTGAVQRWSLGDSTATVKRILDLSSEPGFTSNGEQGLLGAALDPDFQRNGFIYLYQSWAKDSGLKAMIAGSEKASLIVRYKWNPATLEIDSKSRKELLRIPQEAYSNHKAGMIAFGPDQILYIGVGDGGSAGDPHNNSQNLGNLLGKILRIDVRTGEAKVPADNPFVKKAGSKGEIWAYGLRNPWRFSFDRLSKELWVGDVGQGRFEEIDLIQRGGNFGWKVFEGHQRYDEQAADLPNHVPPLWTYERKQGTSVTGGYVYRGQRFPELQGVYIFGDYGSGRIWTLRKQAEKVRVEEFGRVSSVCSFAEDRDGELFAISISGSIFELK